MPSGDRAYIEECSGHGFRHLPSLHAGRAKALIITDAVRRGWGSREAVLKSLGTLVSRSGIQAMAPVARAQRVGISSEGPRHSPCQVRQGRPQVGQRCCGAAVSRSMGLCWVGVRCQMWLLGLGPREKDPPAGAADIHLSRCGWGKAQGVTDTLRGWFGVWGGWSQFSGSSVSGVRLLHTYFLMY